MTDQVPIHCERIRELLWQYNNERLDENLAQMVETHPLDCRDCRICQETEGYHTNPQG